MDLDEYAQVLMQDVLAESDADGEFSENVFFQKACELIVDSGELESADRVHFKTPRGIRVDGYGGDPSENNDGTLSLIVLDFDVAHSASRLTATAMRTLFNRLSNYVKHALNDRWRDSLEETSPAFGLADLIHQNWSQVSKLRLLMVSNRVLSERINGRADGTIDGRPVLYSVWDMRRLHRFATSSAEREELEIDLIKDFGGALPVLPTQQTEDDHKSYLAVLPGEVLADIYDRWGTRLLEQNVRVFLQAKGKVNRGIRSTLENEPSRFFAYNNGITATAAEVDIRRSEGQMVLRRLTDFQIVNGGQTTASVHLAKLRGLDISNSFVQMKLSVVSAEVANSLVPKISEYANSQNRVSAADFFSNHPFHVRMEGFSRRIYAPAPDGSFRQSKWFYERARGQYADARAHLTTSERKKFDLEHPRRQLFTKTDLAKFINVWKGLPHEVSLGAQKNFAGFAQQIGKAWNRSQNDFNEAWYREAVAKAIVFRATERSVSSQSWYQGGYRANIVAYTISKIAHEVAQQRHSVDFEAIWQRQAPGPRLSDTIVVVSRHVHDVLVDPPAWTRNVTEWAKKEACWDQVLNLKVDFMSNLEDELVSESEYHDSARVARREQRQLNGIEAQIEVVKAGGQFWKDALGWERLRKILTPTEIGVLEVAASIPQRTPTEKQSTKVLEALSKMQREGYGATLEGKN